MSDPPVARVAIVDYGMGNLFSVSQACEHVGLRAVITASAGEIQAADAVILPGVGAFGDAMETLEKLDLINVLLDLAASPTPLLGICLGMQLLMTESQEFGKHRGLGIVEGEVVRLESGGAGSRTVKVPQVGWNRIYPPARGAGGLSGSGDTTWDMPLLAGIPSGEYMYFVHSYYPKPADASAVVSTTSYGPLEFCSSYCQGNVFAFQFHPERSGRQGMSIYRNLAATLAARR
jgi:glutamine amidotransferase